MTSAVIVPFWSRLPAIALYPFRGGALASLVAFALALVLLGWNPIFAILFWFGACRYAFEVLLRTAHGDLRPPPALASSELGLVLRYVGLQGVAIVVPGAVAALADPALGLALFIVFLLVLPAAILALALTGSLGRALDPDLWLSIIARVGWPYLGLIGLLLVIQFSAVNAEQLLQKLLPPTAASAVSVLLGLWALIATFHLMGYLALQYHESFGFQPERLPASQAAAADPDQALLDRAAARIEAGEPEAARELLREEIGRRVVSPSTHELYHRLLLQGSDRDTLLVHGRRLIDLLLREKHDRRALEVARRCIERDPGFVAEDRDQNIALAEKARFAGQSRLAIDLLKAALSDPRPHADSPRWAVLASDLLSRLDQGEVEARALLDAELARCEDPVWRAQLQQQLAILGEAGQ